MVEPVRLRWRLQFGEPVVIEGEESGREPHLGLDETSLGHIPDHAERAVPVDPLQHCHGCERRRIERCMVGKARRKESSRIMRTPITHYFTVLR